MARFGMQHFSTLERWSEWQTAREIEDFRVFASSGMERIFSAVSAHIRAHAEAVVDRFTEDDLRKPHLDRRGAKRAMKRFMRRWGEQIRRLHWFEDGRSARSYIAQIGENWPQSFRAAYWPRLRAAPTLDAAWYRVRPRRGGMSPDVYVRWLQETEDWQDWSMTIPRALDCIYEKPEVLAARVERLERWRAAQDVSAVKSCAGADTVTASDPCVRRWTPLMEAFAAGLFYYLIEPDRILCVPRPALWIVSGQLHREDGPAVEWPTRERYFFWRGVEVPAWLIEEPWRITPGSIRSQINAELRRCMVERFGWERFLRESGAELVAKDVHGELWQVRPLANEAPHRVLQVTNGTLEPDGTRRHYYLRVPPDMRTPHEAVAWTYGLSPEQYELTLRT